MKVLSFDIGIINLAFCVLDDAKKIHKWEVISLCNGTEIENTIDLIKQLDQRPEILDVDVVLLEYQPKMNPKMKVVAESVRSYLIFRGIIEKQRNFKLKNYSAKHKLKCYDGPLPPELEILPTMMADKTKSGLSKMYRIRKKQAIYHCEMLIEDKYKEFFANSKKKDDLADSYLQALSFFLYKEKDKGVVIPKQPTRKQMKYKKFSKSNLKYLLKQFIQKRKNFEQQFIQNAETNDEQTNNEQTNNENTALIDAWIEDKTILKNIVRLYGKDTDKVKETIKKELL